MVCVFLTLYAAPTGPDSARESLLKQVGEKIDRQFAPTHKTAHFPQLDFSFKVESPESFLNELRAFAPLKDIDWVLRSENERPKRLLISDLDSTMISMETLDEMAAIAGVGEEVKRITALGMEGNMDFSTSLTMRLQALKGQLAAPLMEATVERLRTHITPGARTLLKTLRQRGVYTVLVSGGFDFATKAAAEELGFDEYHANRLEIDGRGTFTGQISGRIIDRAAKATLLQTISQARGIDLSETLALGDGANDLDMLNTAGLGIGVNPKEVVRQSVQGVINSGYLDAVSIFSTPVS